MDRIDDYLTPELKSITDHKYLASMLELKVEYTNGEQSQNPTVLIKDEDPHAVANCILFNDLGPVNSGAHSC